MIAIDLMLIGARSNECDTKLVQGSNAQITNYEMLLKYFFDFNGFTSATSGRDFYTCFHQRKRRF